MHRHKIKKCLPTRPGGRAPPPPTAPSPLEATRAFEAPLEEGLRFERRMFHALFATVDQKEGMAAFVEKRKPAFQHR